MKPQVILKSYDLKTEQGRKNIESEIKEYHKKLNGLYPVDMVVSDVALCAFFFTIGGFITLGLGAAALDFGIYNFSRHPREAAYQAQLEVLITAYEKCLEQGGARITSDALFLELMETIAPCLTKEQGKTILTPEFLKPDYALLSLGFKEILAKAPHNREIELVTQKSWLSWGGDAKQTTSTRDTKKADTVSNNSWTDNIHTSAIWCKLYGYKPGAANAKPVDVKATVSSVKSAVVQKLVG